MSTLTKTYTQQNTSSASLSERYNKLIDKLQFSYFGLISMTILIGSIIGGIAAMYIFENNAPMWQFIFCIGFSTMNNVFAISQAPVKWVFNTFVLTVLVNVLLISINVI
jgi:MFS family permease